MQSISFLSTTLLENLHRKSTQKDVYSKRRMFWHKVEELWMALSGIPALSPVLFLCSNSKLTGTCISLRMFMAYFADMHSHVLNL